MSDPANQGRSGRDPEPARIALGTGGSRGIGRGIALRLARDGNDLVLVDRSGEDDGPAVREILALGRRCLHVRCDVSEPEQVEALAGRVTEEMGPVQILVNNAGVTRDNLVLRMRPEEWDTVLGINLRGAFLCTKGFARGMMKARWGRIINVTSVVGLTGNKGQANYTAAKAGLIGFTKSVAKELAERGITVNAVAPGFIETSMTEALPQEAQEALRGNIPLRYFGQPEDVAHAVSYLASDEARYVTGQVLAVDGGMSMS
ncbi:MAG: 3-oxoacyl-[acyl-carrier-protein] reductase [Candidatus Eisenbacteria bacterium]|nr:3-oxoacyl-[acyl-carrier-protein] reductase [Candidatus Latescibacterota bacterium]MBD3302381.1 3-oxoacyl-[acyl-carrier-protein] reductase [Candidatus Eisenbacteria bacterium]